MKTQSISNEQGFSIVETLAVVAIMSILTALTMTTFSSLQSASLTSSGNQIVDVLAMARQNSISQNAYTAVVIKSQGTGAYSSYCLLQLTRQDDGTLGAWTALTPWRSLGRGVVFESGQSNDTFISSSGSVDLPQPLPTTFPLPFQGQQILTSTTTYQCYQPDGTLMGGQASALRLRLIEQVAAPSSGTIPSQGAKVSGQEANYYDLVFISNTGVTKIERP